MQKNRKKAGFTMAELLVVVGIMAALAALAFVGIISYLRTATKLEYDNYAKEIFVAAQNHLTMAKSQGFLGRLGANAFGTPEVPTDKDGVNYFVVSGTNRSSLESSTVLSLMLPFGAVDDTIRSGGDYIVRYHKAAGEVLDVYYWQDSGRYAYTETNPETAHDALINVTQSDGATEESIKNEFKNFKDEKAVIGWFGGENAKTLTLGTELTAPKVTVKNAEKLIVEVNNSGNSSAKDASLKLLITGVTSKAEKEYKLCANGPSDTTKGDNPDKNANILNETGDELTSSNRKNGKYCIVLDDITSAGMHFYDLFCANADSDPKNFIPGEDITIQAVAYNNKSLTNIAYSAIQTTNSLFASSQKNGGGYTASITNIRHLENLDENVSNLAKNGVSAKVVTSLAITGAEQKADLSWTKFKTEIDKGEDKLFVTRPKNYSKDTEVNSTNKEDFKLTASDKYYPVTLGSVLTYDGKNHSIFGVDVNFTDSTEEKGPKGAGLFGTLTAGEKERKVQNLKLIDFNITGTGNAGALVGTLSGAKATATVSNVVAFNSSGARNTITGGANAGGLIGAVTGGAKVEKSAAAMIVTATGNAGGLIGSAANGTAVTACYSGGHTVNGSYKIKAQTNPATGFELITNSSDVIVYNVTATGTTDTTGIAGGLIGDAGNATITSCYSTCSAKGATVGGFVGNASGAKVQACYCTGLVEGGKTENEKYIFGANEGAFAGTFDGTATGCNYFEIINERETANGIEYLKAKGSGTAGTAGADLSTVVTTGSETKTEKVTAFDATVNTYNSFVGAPKNGTNWLWQTAVPYDVKLVNYYQGHFNLKTVEQLLENGTLNDGQEDKTDYFVRTHYGDWPAPEIFVVNKAS